MATETVYDIFPQDNQTVWNPSLEQEGGEAIRASMNLPSKEEMQGRATFMGSDPQESGLIRGEHESKLTVRCPEKAGARVETFSLILQNRMGHVIFGARTQNAGGAVVPPLPLADPVGLIPDDFVVIPRGELARLDIGLTGVQLHLNGGVMHTVKYGRDGTDSSEKFPIARLYGVLVRKRDSGLRESIFHPYYAPHFGVTNVWGLEGIREFVKFNRISFQLFDETFEVQELKMTLKEAPYGHQDLTKGVHMPLYGFSCIANRTPFLLVGDAYKTMNIGANYEDLRRTYPALRLGIVGKGTRKNTRFQVNYKGQPRLTGSVWTDNPVPEGTFEEAVYTPTPNNAVRYMLETLVGPITLNGRETQDWLWKSWNQGKTA